MHVEESNRREIAIYFGGLFSASAAKTNTCGYVMLLISPGLGTEHTVFVHIFKKQTIKQANKQTHKHANKQTNKQIKSKYIYIYIYN